MLNKYFLAAFIFFSALTSSVSAEIQTFTGVGEYVMSDFETPDVAKTRAKYRAERNALEQAGVYVESVLNVENQMVTSEMILTATTGILKIDDVNYELTPINKDSLLITATLTATIDTDQVAEFINKRHDELMNDAEVYEEEHIQLSLSEQADEYFFNGFYRKAILLYTQLIAKDYNNEVLYTKRAISFAELGEYRRALFDFKRAQSLDPKNVWIQKAIDACKNREKVLK